MVKVSGFVSYLILNFSRRKVLKIVPYKSTESLQILPADFFPAVFYLFELTIIRATKVLCFGSVGGTN